MFDSNLPEHCLPEHLENSKWIFQRRRDAINAALLLAMFFTLPIILVVLLFEIIPNSIIPISTQYNPFNSQMLILTLVIGFLWFIMWTILILFAIYFGTFISKSFYKEDKN